MLKKKVIWNISNNRDIIWHSLCFCLILKCSAPFPPSGFPQHKCETLMQQKRSSILYLLPKNNLCKSYQIWTSWLCLLIWKEKWVCVFMNGYNIILPSLIVLTNYSLRPLCCNIPCLRTNTNFCHRNLSLLFYVYFHNF